MEETKTWYTSKGIIGSAGAVIAGILGIWFAGIEAEKVTEILLGIGTIVAGITAMIGRIKASKKIG